MLREACSVCRLVIADAPLPSLRRLGIYAQLLALLTDPQTREELDEPVHDELLRFYTLPSPPN